MYQVGQSFRQMSWDEAEKLFPGCSAQWDVQDGDEVVRSYGDYSIEIRTIADILYVDIIAHNRNVEDWITWLSAAQKWDIRIMQDKIRCYG